MAPTTIPAAMSRLLQADPSRPLITWIGGQGLRTELSVRTYENNVAKAANLLQDDAAVSPGSLVALAVPPHWQTSVWLGACAVTGCAGWLGGDVDDIRVEVAVIGPDRLERGLAPLTLATALHPLGMPFSSPLPEGVLDAAVEVRAHSDRFVAYAEPTPDSPWLVTDAGVRSQQAAMDDARDLALTLALGDGGRLLCPVSGGYADPRVALALLALPLATAGSVVLLDDAGGDVGAIADVERCDAVLR